MKRPSATRIISVLLLALAMCPTSPLPASADPQYDEHFRHTWRPSDDWDPDRYLDEVTFTMQFESGDASGIYETELGTKVDRDHTTHVEFGFIIPQHDPGTFRFFVNVAEPNRPSYKEVDFVDLGWGRRHHTFWFWVKKEWGKTWHFKMYDCDTAELLYSMTFDHATVQTCSPIFEINMAMEYWDYGFNDVAVTTGQTAHTVPGNEWANWQDYDWQDMFWTDPMPEHGRHDPMYFVDESICCQGPVARQQAILNTTHRPLGDDAVYPQSTQPQYSTSERIPQQVAPRSVLGFDEFAYLAHVLRGAGAEYQRTRAWHVPE